MRIHLAALAIAFAPAMAAIAQPTAPNAGPYVPTPHAIADRMLALAGIGPDDYLVDLGSGDGRLVMGAVAKYGARGAMGVEIKDDLVRDAQERAKQAGLGDRVKFVAGDLFKQDIRQATVVTAYLIPHIMGEVEAKLGRELEPGTRVVVHDYPLPTWRPLEVVKFESDENVAISGSTRTVLYLYQVPREAPRP
jgi:protein-L-isoaspartate O-methyltransferase